MQSLPIFYTDNQDLSLLQTKWASILNPVIKNPTNQANILNNIKLINGTTVVNHLLGRNLQGWKVILQNAKASIYDAQSTNQTPELTLILISDALVTVSLEVF